MTDLLGIIVGGGELGTAAGHALHRAGARLLVVDRPLPAALRLGVAFAAAAIAGRVEVEGVVAVHCSDKAAIEAAWARGEVAVWTGGALPEGLWAGVPDVWIDARMRQLAAPRTSLGKARVTIGLGPGFVAGRDVDYVIETNRGPRLGQVIASGGAEAHTAVPGLVEGHREARVLRSPCAGVFERALDLGAFVEAGDVAGYVAGQPVVARIAGMVRGLKLDGVEVGAGHKVGDVDPRRDRALCGTMTDKARAVGEGALRALALAGLVKG